MFNNDGSAGVAGNRRTPPPRLGKLFLAVTNTALEKCWRRVIGRAPPSLPVTEEELGILEILAGMI